MCLLLAVRNYNCFSFIFCLLVVSFMNALLFLCITHFFFLSNKPCQNLLCILHGSHHKNPVGKEWRWKTDDPHFIVQQAVETHVQMIKEAKGIPGVRLDRWKEAHTVRHCALSLVGEPIMYPRIDELLADLHERKISTFLVTNGQHPTAIGTLRPITQLYVSVDAPTKQSLIEIDRPLFQDAWERLKQSLVGLKDKGQRTVARLTVVKGWNSDEVEGYAALVALGKVSLVEVKGVTFCGKSDASNLNMSNTPWHHEVVALTQKLKEELDKIRLVDNSCPEYGLACEHKHSCSVLLARVDQFTGTEEEEDSTTVAGQPRRQRWRTWIDYDKFHELAARHAQDESFTFQVSDYTAPTPSWALFGASEEGFDPTETRHRKKHKHPKYTQFDARGVPTHNDENQPLSIEERERLAALLKERQAEIGSAASVVTEHRDGAKEIADASLMFRGMVVVK
jgi:tRNA wybutosine-synthesizing protein 1